MNAKKCIGYFSDRRALRKVCGESTFYFQESSLEKMSFGDVEKRIDERFLSIFGGNQAWMMEFKSAVMELGGVLTGSFLLQCILDEKWNSGGIDIFFPNPQRIQLIETAFSKIRDFNYSNLRFCDKFMHLSFFPGPTGPSVLNYSREYCFNDQIIQFLFTSLETTQRVCEWIEEKFDFSVVRNCAWVNSKGRWVVRIYSHKDLVDRSFWFDYFLSLEDSFERKIKYEERGFTVKMGPSRDLVLKETKKRNLGVSFYNFGYLRVFPKAGFERCRLERCEYNLLTNYHLHGYWFPFAVIAGEEAFNALRTTEILFALQNARWPVLILIEILKWVKQCNTVFCNSVRLWDIVKTIRHSRYAQTARLLQTLCGTLSK